MVPASRMTPTTVTAVTMARAGRGVQPMPPVPLARGQRRPGRNVRSTLRIRQVIVTRSQAALDNTGRTWNYPLSCPNGPPDLWPTPRLSPPRYPAEIIPPITAAPPDLRGQTLRSGWGQERPWCS